MDEIIWTAFDEANQHIAENRVLSGDGLLKHAQQRVSPELVVAYCQEYRRVLAAFSSGADIAYPPCPRPSDDLCFCDACRQDRGER